MPADFKQDIGTPIQYVASAMKAGVPVDLTTLPGTVYQWETDRPDAVTFDDATIQNPDITLTTGIDDGAPANVMLSIQASGGSVHQINHTFSTNVVVTDPIDSIDFAPLTASVKKAGISRPNVFAKAGKIFKR